MDKQLINYISDTTNPEFNYELGLAYKNLGHTSSAISYLLRAAERSEDLNLSYECLLLIADCFIQQKNRDFTVKGLYLHAITVLPKRPEAYYLLSKLYETRAEYSECYTISEIGLNISDFDLPPLRTYFGHSGKCGLMFQKAFVSWWWGKGTESRKLFKELAFKYWDELDENLKSSVEKECKIFLDRTFFELEYQKVCNTFSNISENLPILFELAKECNHVTEMGVRAGASTRAFLNTDVILRSYDLYIDDEVNNLFNKAKQFGKDVNYIKANVLDIKIEETDLLFIDTWHCYNQLKEELKLHSPKVRKYIAFHDTHTYGTNGESYSVTIENGYNENPIGLLPAIIEFLIEHPEWKFKIHKTNNNGLTVIERI